MRRVKSPVTGAEVLAEMLDGYGVSHVFMVPAILRRTMYELEERTTIRRIQTHGEKAAAYMADGYARAAGRPGVCMAQGVGALNLAAGLRDAWLAHSPVIAFIGGTTPATVHRKRYQDVNDLPAFANVTKFSACVETVERIPDLVRQAFRVATTGAPGPVSVQFAGQEGEIDEEEAQMAVLVEPEFARVPALRPRPNPEAIEAAARRLVAAARPVIVAGGGVRSSRAADPLVALAEALQIPVATSLNGKDSIPGNHPLCVGVVGTYSRAAANRIVGAADLVLFVGTETGSMTTNFWQVPAPGTPVIQIDIAPEALGRNYPAEIAILADAAVALQELVGAVVGEGGEPREEWIGHAQAEVERWWQGVAPLVRSDAAPIRPERICGELTELLGPDAIVVVDTGHAGMWMGGFFDIRYSEQRYLRSAGHLGWAFPAGLGAKCACPDRPVVTFTGDSGFLYHLAEVETAVRAGINTVTVVNNNRAGNQAVKGFDRAYGGKQSERAKELWMFNELDLARVATEMGALGIRVERASDIRPAIEQALGADRPVVVDIVSDIEAMAPLAEV